MKDTLQLHEIAGCLPYELKFVITQKGRHIETIKLSGITIDAGELTIWSKDSESGYGAAFEKKPILRPMSDFDNPKVYTGEFYSFMGELNSTLTSDYQIDRDLEFDFERPAFVNCRYALEVYTFLYRNHFDIHNLIGRGLAIDQNTLKD